MLLLAPRDHATCSNGDRVFTAVDLQSRFSLRCGGVYWCGCCCRADKEKQTLVIEIESVTTALDQANKAKVLYLTNLL